MEHEDAKLASTISFSFFTVTKVEGGEEEEGEEERGNEKKRKEKRWMRKRKREEKDERLRRGGQFRD
uniref:Uncharacterized protein n=1 Tax=Vespula pensylvanica TaxID=30213 RepID=A0A834PAE4_VESPE|nr:hypothetical protein H0235_002608 [Vespula pensylvanica]